MIRNICLTLTTMAFAPIVRLILSYNLPELHQKLAKRKYKDNDTIEWYMNYIDANDRSLIMACCKYGNLDILKNIHDKTLDYSDEFLCACTEGHSNVIKWFLEEVKLDKERILGARNNWLPIVQRKCDLDTLMLLDKELSLYGPHHIINVDDYITLSLLNSKK